MKRQVLTEQQYKRANKVMLFILAICYVFFAIIEISNVMKHGQSIMAYVRCGIYAAALALTAIMVKALGTKKVGTIVIALIYAAVYPVLVFGNGAGTLVIAFPAIIGFMIFLNEPLVITGSVVTFVVSAIKYIVLSQQGAKDGSGNCRKIK